jgi:hypothetical protein
MQLQELVNVIESRADELAERIVQKVRESPRMAAYHRFGDEELAARARLVYANLGNWLEEESEGLVEEEYFRLGTVRSLERIPLSQVVWALLLIRRNLWHFVQTQGWETASDLEETLRLELLVVRFFDRAILHAVRGYESVSGGPVAQPYPEEAPFWPGG